MIAETVVYDWLSIRMAQWLTTAGEIEELVDAIDIAVQRLPVPDAEYEDLCRLRDAAQLALDGWSNADAAFARLTVAYGRRREAEQ